MLGLSWISVVLRLEIVLHPGSEGALLKWYEITAPFIATTKERFLVENRNALVYDVQ